MYSLTQLDQMGNISAIRPFRCISNRHRIMCVVLKARMSLRLDLGILLLLAVGITKGHAVQKV